MVPRPTLFVVLRLKQLPNRHNAIYTNSLSTVKQLIANTVKQFTSYTKTSHFYDSVVSSNRTQSVHPDAWHILCNSRAFCYHCANTYF